MSKNGTISIQLQQNQDKGNHNTGTETGTLFSHKEPEYTGKLGVTISRYTNVLIICKC